MQEFAVKGRADGFTPIKAGWLFNVYGDEKYRGVYAIIGGKIHVVQKQHIMVEDEGKIQIRQSFSTARKYLDENANVVKRSSAAAKVYNSHPESYSPI